MAQHRSYIMVVYTYVNRLQHTADCLPMSQLKLANGIESNHVQILFCI